MSGSTDKGRSKAVAFGDVVVFAAAWLLILAMLVLDLTGLWRRGTYFRLQGAGLLLMLGVVLVSMFAEFRGWPASRLHVLRMITFPLVLPGFALVLIGVFVHVRARREGQLLRKAADDTGH